MQNNKGFWIIVLLAVTNFMMVASFSMFNAIFSTAIGVFFSVTWLFIMSKILEEKYQTEQKEFQLTFKNQLVLLAPAIIYFTTIWGVMLGVYYFK